MGGLLKKIKCYRCKGMGVVNTERINFFGIFTMTEESGCPACHGDGWIYE